ncbi:Dothistromin biosynthesis peroxidase dotB [Fulvia fulva]|uniref:Dothistromin biosynthesis peroxidase dotB n=1 Tax=Passalora fulva TaxID=5499 RepID=A0A9Q8LCS9_PASFU|nr:Dothistromin biosynthesis peroxidase dotB [Fulvia fulva]KAK4629555.1 Dothistromin biosynthesis peroxidase dotB [Fulvia fulva]KAK4630790.1 Dothistromin biosynthesis peroxidase dotB [Fulvia fulva]UJO15156.1 Dothistromin biosynthesis peroxidase dotB [Fulvia fulva]WPV12451.1 Dothistromin biosynthesis peroxidase dotB [Fulvia fulva]WPV27546.1 Dothistromin biosynthesis peroxidase dotB [Fulvia fulva]
MKFTTTQALLALAPLASAFPAAVYEALQNDPAVQARTAEILAERQLSADSATALFEANPTFSESQLIDVGPGSGHEYTAPGPNDIRGPCPGLNAFANHGFLPKSGYATITQFIDVTTNVVGMGPILAAFLAVLGAVLDGSGTAWSIGGPPPASVGGLALLGRGNGLTGSHNKYESDASPTKPDLYESGNNYETMVDQFQQLIDISPGGFVDLNTLAKHRSNRFDTQIKNNPYFFNGPFTGVLVQPAAYTFIYRFMANHSAENPVGELSYDVIKDWFGITGESGSFVANQGQERIPLNWYRRSLTAPYESTYFLADAAAAGAIYPKFFNVGGNTGTKDSFSGVDVSDLSGGLFNSASLAQGNNFACFAMQFAVQAKPDILLGPLTQLTSALGSLTSALACPQLTSIDEAQLERFPGYQKSTQDGITK